MISENANKTDDKPSNQAIADKKDQVEKNPKVFETKVEPALKTEEKDNVMRSNSHVIQKPALGRMKLWESIIPVKSKDFIDTIDFF